MPDFVCQSKVPHSGVVETCQRGIYHNVFGAQRVTNDCAIF